MATVFLCQCFPAGIDPPSSRSYIEKINILLKSGDTEALQQTVTNIPDNKRPGIARELIATKQFGVAYQILSVHKIDVSHPRYVDAEWLCGFLCLRRLSNPHQAGIHFSNMANSATTFHTKAKSAFWLALAKQEQGNVPDCLFWLAVASQFSATFYGQLTQVYLCRVFSKSLKHINHITPFGNGFLHTPVIPSLASWLQSFVCTEHGGGGIMGQNIAPPLGPNITPPLGPNIAPPGLNNMPPFGPNITPPLGPNIAPPPRPYTAPPHIAPNLPQMLCSALYKVDHFTVLRVYDMFLRTYASPSSDFYPLLTTFVKKEHLNVIYSTMSGSLTKQMCSASDFRDLMEALTHAITLNESRFNRVATSPAGAKGMMQLMPRTAKAEFNHLVKQKLVEPGESFDICATLDNLILGISHLKTLIGEFGVNVALIASAYNAGAKNVRAWLDTYGDPRTGAISMLEWVELIPFKETRLYVQHVLAAFSIYTCLLNTEKLQDWVWSLFL
ncbi:MAG: lytic transglycosylase domain-containing protein [Holosporales bacterium]|jgi:hypothetical protein|nr:lytic transglycosylase domain-containing protein [Holosporales bacterium]